MFEKTFSVPYYGLDGNERLKTGLLLQFFQEAAALHADSRKIGVADLLKHDATWVLRRYRVRIYAYPGLGDLTVRTWYEPQRNLMSVRLFELRDAGGALVADAWSGWIVVDLNRGRPVRLDRVLPPEYYDAVDPVGEELSDTIEPVGDAFDLERHFHVRWQELDLNGHTNHTVYFDWALESVPDEVYRDHLPAELDAEYLTSVPRGDVTVRTRKYGDAPLSFAHAVYAGDIGTEAARLATVWRRVG